MLQPMPLRGVLLSPIVLFLISPSTFNQRLCSMLSTVSNSFPQTLLQTELSLTRVDITFLMERPKTKIKIVINLDGMDTEVEIDKGGSVQWIGEIRSAAGTKISVHILCRNRVKRWSKSWKIFTSAEALLTEYPPPIFDKQGQIQVTLTAVSSHLRHGHSGGLKPSFTTSMAPAIEYNYGGTQFRDVIAAVTAAHDKVANKTVVVEKLGKIWAVLEVLRDMGEPLKEIHPAVAMTMTAVGNLMELCEKQKAYRDDAVNLVEEFMPFLTVQDHMETLRKRAETQHAVKNMLGPILEASKYILENTSPGGFLGVIGDLLDGSEYKEKVHELRKKFLRAKEAFDRSVALTTFAAVDGITVTTQLMFLHDKLSECDNAHFTSDGGCLKDTRVDLRQSVEKWLDSTDEASSNIFWLYGKAGSGKSTIANTVAKMVQDDRGYHLSCFICKRDDSSLSSPRRLLPTLAYSFAYQHESYRAAITNLLQSPDGVGIATTADVKTQFDKLFQGLIPQTVDPLQLHVIVLDGIDECGSAEDRRKLATHALALSRTAPWIKIFITSRDEPEIHNVFSEASDCITRNINDETGVDGDIRLYIQSRIAELNLPLSHDDIEDLVKQADGLFIWCRTLFEYLRDGIGARHFLEPLLSRKGHTASQPWSQLYGLYDKILDSVLGPHALDAVPFMRALLSVVNITASTQPLSAKAIMCFLHGHEAYSNFGVEDAEKIIKSLHSVLFVDRSANSVVRVHHTSFHDFLRWKVETSAKLEWETSDATHQLMVRGCLRTLKQELKFNICKIETPVLNKDIPDLAQRLSTCISEMLRYSSRYWFTHLEPFTASTASELVPLVLELFSSKMLLFWLESLSLQGVLSQVEFACLTYLRVFFHDHPDILSVAEDAHQFVTSFAPAMDSTPHIYLSALIWLPEESLVYQNLQLSKRTEWQLISNKRQNWDVHVWRSDPLKTRSAVFSPDSRFVASGTEGGDIYIRDSQTGALEGEPLRSHRDAVWSLAYSPDGRFIASGSEDQTVQIWDVKTGKAIFAPLEGHGRSVRSVAFSPDGLFIASGSIDNTIRIWDAQTGKLEGKPLQHSDWVRAVAYSPNGQFIVSACDDRCVHVWDSASRQEILEPLKGHRGWIRAVTYSPDGKNIVSGSADNTIRVWNAQTGEAITKPLRGHSNWVRSVKYSPDGRFILSGSHDGTIRHWDAVSHSPFGEPLEVSDCPVRSVSYSTDGSLIISASDDGIRVWDISTCFVAGSSYQDHVVRGDIRTPAICAVTYSHDGHFIASGSDQIRIWDAHTGTLMDQPALTHPETRQGSRVRSVAYSPDGQFIASGSADNENSSVCLLDPRTGATVSPLLRGHSRNISSVACSPDGRTLASASWDSTVTLWDVPTGTAIGEPLQAGSPVLSVAFSPDGHLIAGGTEDGSICTWDINTRTSLRCPIRAHSSSVYSVVFSPDGCHIASVSHDCSLKIWCAQTGEALNIPIQGHHNYVLSVAYSPDGRFIASSSSGEVIIWDAQRGSAYKTLRGPSTDIQAVAYSPDGHFLVSGAWNGKIYVHEVSDEYDDTKARWISGCAQMDMRDGWVKDGETLLLWVPVPYRGDVRFCAHLVISNQVSNIGAYNVDWETLLKYSGRNWTDIFSSFSD